MTSLRFRVLLFVFLICPFAIIVSLVRKKKLQIKYGIVWMIPIIGIMLIVFFPRGFKTLADFLGIYETANMLLLLGIICSLIINFSLTIAVSRLSARVRTLTQTLALDEKDCFLQNTNMNELSGIDEAEMIVGKSEVEIQHKP